MRTLKACALSLALIPMLSSAEINKAGKADCKAFAKEQLQEIKQDYYGALSRDEVTLALKVAERSCLAMYDTVEEERAAFKAQPAQGEKVHWWEEVGENEKAIPNIKKAQKTGGK